MTGEGDDDGDTVIVPGSAPALGRWRRILTTAKFPRTQAEIDADVVPVDYRYEPGNVRRYGAKGDGSTDDTLAIQRALSIASNTPTFPTLSTGPGRIYFPRGDYVVSDTLYFQYVSAWFDQDAFIIVNAGSFNVIRYGRGAFLVNPRVRVNSLSFQHAAHYVSGEDRLQSITDAPRALYPSAFGNTTIVNNSSKAFHLHSREPSTAGDSAISFVRFYGARANAFGNFAVFEADGSHPGITGQVYVTSNFFTDFFYSLCVRGIEINNHSGANGVVANEFRGHMNAHTDYGGSASERAVYANSSQNHIDIQVWDWAVSLPTHSVILEGNASRCDIVLRGQSSSRISDTGGANGANSWRAAGTASGGAYHRHAGSLEVVGGTFLNNGVDLGGASGNFTGALTGVDSTVEGTFTWVRSGNIITLRRATGLTGTSNSANFTLTGLPAEIRPAVAKLVPTLVVDNGASGQFAAALVNTDGTIQFGRNGISGGFAPSGSKGFNSSWTLVYGLA